MLTITFWSVMLVVDLVLWSVDLQADRFDLAWWTIFLVVIDLIFIYACLPSTQGRAR